MKNILGSNSIIVNKKQKALLNQIEKPFSEYSLVFNNCMVYNGMSFELNTPSLWNSRKYRSFNLLDYARKIKYLVMNKKNQMKVAQLINKYNS
jgi:hypothetical protein